MPRVIHFEIHADDPERCRAFYESVFGWEFSRFDGPEDYWLVKTGEPDEPGIDGGMMRRLDPRGNVYNTIHVPDIDEFITRIERNGGEIVVAKMPVPGVGYLAYFRDTEGNVSGVMEEDENAG